MEVDEDLKAKIVSALKAACSGDPSATVDLQPSGPHRVGGVVLSTAFTAMSPSERQDAIWRELDLALSPTERTRISFIVTDTPDEYRLLTSA